ncbi:MAG: hypothetical protein RL230_2283 [Pseudomonadota bacterium]
MASEQSEDFTLLKALKVYGRFFMWLNQRACDDYKRIIFGLVALGLNICFGLTVVGVLGFFNTKLNELVIGLGTLATFLFSIGWFTNA